MGKIKNSHKHLLIKSVGTPTYKCESNTKRILKKMGMRCALHSSGLRQDPLHTLVNTKINLHGKKPLTNCRLRSMELVPLLFLRFLNLKIKRQFCTRALPLAMTTLISQLTEGVNIYKLFLEESFVFQFPIWKYKDQDKIIILPVSYGCAVWSLTQAVGVRGQSAEEDIWT